jgi:hypothetical protein
VTLDLGLRGKMLNQPNDKGEGRSGVHKHVVADYKSELNVCFPESAVQHPSQPK